MSRFDSVTPSGFDATTRVRRCRSNHVYHTDQVEARWRTKAGQARYWCPLCLRAGTMPPKAWTRVTVSGRP